MAKQINKKTCTHSFDIDVADYIDEQDKKGMNKSRLVNDACRKQFKLGKVKSLKKKK